MSQLPGLAGVPTAENVRFHAAGHISASIILIEGGYAKQSRSIMEQVLAYISSEKVDAPMALRMKVIGAIENPDAALVDLRILESWFCDPFNTVIEKSELMN